MSSNSSNNNSNRCKKRYKYILSIQRNMNSGLQLMAVCSNVNIAKSIVKSIYDNYIKVTGDKRCESYNPNFWEHSKNDPRYWFYVLNKSATAYYQILKLEENALAASFVVKRDN